MISVPQIQFRIPITMLFTSTARILCFLHQSTFELYVLSMYSFTNLAVFRSFNIMNINLKFNSGDQTGTVCTTYRSNKKSEISGYSRQVLRLFMSTGLCSYGAIFFYVVIFNLPTVYSILMYIL